MLTPEGMYQLTLQATEDEQEATQAMLRQHALLNPPKALK